MVKLAEYFGGFDLAQFGIYPRRADGLAGILFAPFLHGSFSHLFANTAPVVVIGTLLFYAYPRAAKILLPAVYLGGGGAVWLFMREAYRIGASGIAFGMLFFVLTIGIIRWERRAIAIAVVIFLLYGGMIWSILPEAPEISFESHLSGALVGVLLALLLKNRDLEPPLKQYSCECDDAEADDYDWPL